jgi:hypothetical protein
MPDIRSVRCALGINICTLPFGTVLFADFVVESGRKSFVGVKYKGDVKSYNFKEWLPEERTAWMEWPEFEAQIIYVCSYIRMRLSKNFSIPT